MSRQAPTQPPLEYDPAQRERIHELESGSARPRTLPRYGGSKRNSPSLSLGRRMAKIQWQKLPRPVQMHLMDFDGADTRAK
jgi:hypothetical protein